MARRANSVQRLDNTISALERLVLEGSDDEIFSQRLIERSVVDDVEIVIKRCLASLDASAAPSPKGADRAPSPSVTRRVTGAPRALVERLAMLRRLAAMHPELSPRYGAVFGAGQTPTSEELDDLMQELVRRGLISKDGLEKK